MPTADASTIQQTTHDVAVTNIQGPSGPVSQGDILNIGVTVQNLSDVPETFPVSLHDDTDSRAINTVPITLNPGQAETVEFQWDTSDASPSAHVLTGAIAVANDPDLSNNSLTVSPPIMVVPAAPADIILGDGTGLELPDASFGASLLQPDINTQAISQSSIFIGNAGASLTGALVRIHIDTVATDQQNIFVAGADATFQPSAPLQKPFGQDATPGEAPGEVQGMVHLEGLSSSLGGYVMVGQEVHFVDSNGSFKFTSPSGTFDIIIQAPGYLSVTISDAQIDPEEVLTIPELTLLFGDGNGKVDILDLSRAGNNFGEATPEITLP